MLEYAAIYIDINFVSKVKSSIYFLLRNYIKIYVLFTVL